jgi:hypothetical protein
MPLMQAQGPFNSTTTVARSLSRTLLNIVEQPVPDYKTLKMWIQFASTKPGFKRIWLPRLDAARLTGRLGEPIFLNALKNAIFNEFEASSRDPTRSAIPFEMLYAYHHPNLGSESFWSRNKYWYVRALVSEGNAMIVSGERGAGKTDTGGTLFPTIIADLKKDHIERGEYSDLAQLVRDINRASRVSVLPKAMGASPNAEVDSGKRMGLYHSKDVRFPTNISIDKGSPYKDYFQACWKMSDYVTQMCTNGLNDVMSIPTLDELGFNMNRQRAMSTHNFAIAQLLIIIRKFNACLIAIAQSAERQLSRELTEGAHTMVHKLRKDTAIFTVQGFQNAQRVRDIPGSPVAFQTRAFAAFTVDILPALLVEVVSEREREVRAAGEPWDYRSMYNESLAYIERNKPSDAQINAGLTGVISANIRHLLQTINPATGEVYNPATIAKELEVDVERVKKEIDAMRADAKKKKEGKQVPKINERGDEILAAT